MSKFENEKVELPTQNKCLCGRAVLVLTPPLSDSRTQSHCEHIIPRTRPEKQIDDIKAAFGELGYDFV